MEAETFARKLKAAGIETVTGIPDSTLQQFCDVLAGDSGGAALLFQHIVPENEGAAVGIAIGEYLATGRPACVYMQNSGLGNIVNPLTSLAHTDVYGIPMLLLIGWRGEPGTKDEPQHTFMGRITTELLALLEIPCAVMDGGTTPEELDDVLAQAGQCFAQGRQFAIVIKKNSFVKHPMYAYQNGNVLPRETAVRKIAQWLREEDIIISTTGKISRELYEALDDCKGDHRQAFLTVGGMGHAKMIAYGIARRRPDRRVFCLDGDGAVLMHMGGLAVTGRQPLANLVHICLDNEAHESVGGMPTGAAGQDYGTVAGACGYRNVCRAATEAELLAVLQKIDERKEMTFVHVRTALGSRDDLGRPKETPQQNKKAFMEVTGAER
ncbi:phosphonopyruvate decarboxylase [Lachnospiraceae bacterium JLR.KK008]